MPLDQINQMVAAVEEGFTSDSVWETSLTYPPGATVKVNKATTGKDPDTGASIPVPEGEIVSILGVGGGDAGVDHHVRLKDGRQAYIPYYDLGESTLRREGVDLSEDLTGSVAKVTLAKPLPQGAMEFLEGGYADYGVRLPMKPSADSTTSVTFLMKAPDEETLEMGMDSLKKLAGASFKSSGDSSLTDWAKAVEG